jgi:predicted ester cyclase
MVEAKEIVRRLIEEPWSGDFSIFDEYVAPDFVGYDAAEPEPIRGPAGMKANVEKYLAGFSNARCTVDEQIAEGNTVATRWTGRGTHDGEIAGIAPTGKEITVSGLTISRLENGVLVEERTIWDALGMLVQLGAVPMPTTA